MASPIQPARANPSAIATWVELGPGRRLQAPTRSRKCSRLIQARCSTASRSISAICAAGPPNAVSPRRIKKRNNSASLPAVVLVHTRPIAVPAGLAASAHAGINGDGNQAEQHGQVGARFVQKTEHAGVAHVLRHGERSQRPPEQDGDLCGDDRGDDDRKQAERSLARVEVRQYGGPSSNFNCANQRAEYLRSDEADMGESPRSQFCGPDKLEDPFADKHHGNDDADQNHGKASAHIASVSSCADSGSASRRSVVQKGFDPRREIPGPGRRGKAAHDVASSIDEEFREVPLDPLDAKQARPALFQKAIQRVGGWPVHIDFGRRWES